MTQHRQHKIAYLRNLHEILFSLTAGFVGTFAVVPRLPESLRMSLYRMNRSIYDALHMQYSRDLLTYDFAFLVIGVPSALCIWAFLRLSKPSSLTREILRSVSGVTAVAALPVLWSVEFRPWRAGWYLIETMMFFEAGLAVVCVFLYLYEKLPLPAWGSGALLVTHLVPWSREFELRGEMFWILRSYPVRTHLLLEFLFVPYGRPITWVVACCSSVVWVLYVRRLRQIQAAP